MFVGELDTDVTLLLGALTSAVDELLSACLTSLPTSAVMALMRGLEVQRRRLAPVDHAVIAELEGRGAAAEFGARNTASVLTQSLRISPAEANARVKAAKDLGPRRDLGGALLPPLFPVVTAAQAAGALSPQHARVITGAIDALPCALQAEHCDSLEAGLAEHALTLAPDQLRKVADFAVDRINPDGRLSTDHDHRRLRDVVLHVNADGSGFLGGRLTPACLAVVQATLDPLSRPRPASEDVRDSRTCGQRRHDALQDACERLLRSGTLSDSGGIPATVIVTMTVDQLETRTGLATTEHGGVISVNEALALADEAKVIPTVLGDHGGVLSYGRARRFATTAQRLALAGRDGGCSFPGCDVPASWTQSHHVLEWDLGGPTELDNLTLVCGVHHREHKNMGWACQITDGVAQWLPPWWIDPERKPRRNTVHHVDVLALPQAA